MKRKDFLRLFKAFATVVAAGADVNAFLQITFM